MTDCPHDVQVLYNLFEWPARRGSRLAVVAVANTMDLPERLLPRIASRLGGRRLVFQPYNRPQLVTIVSSRLRDAGLADTFAENAINMACSKVGPSFFLFPQELDRGRNMSVGLLRLL